MQTKSGSRPLALTFSLLLFALLFAFPARAQSRDHLTPQEVLLIQDAQILDKRIEVFIKAAERRMQVLTGVQTIDAKQQKKDSELWGELPTGSHAELIDDIAKILEEAITNIDDVGMHDEKSPLLPKAVRKLAAAATQITNQLTPIKEQSKSAAELSAIEQALENCKEILDAANKLPPPSEPKAKEKKPKG
jgi:hypothetical protein